jgi:DNA polymerase-3 subunit delta'
LQPFSHEILGNGAGFILVSNDLDHALNALKSDLVQPYIFPKPYKEQTDILVEDVEELFAEAYLTSEHLKTIILKSITYRSEVQNRLLKILEEPPHNIRFIVLAKSPSALLPTIRSRISTYFLTSSKEEPLIRFDVSNISLKAIFDFLKLCEKLQLLHQLNKDSAKTVLYTLLEDLIRLSGKNQLVSQETIMKFERAFELLGLNTMPKIVFADILLSLLHKKQSI